MSRGKTNAVRLLDSAGIEYELREYSVDDGAIDGLSVARKVGMEPEMVFKTLVATGDRTGPVVFCLPVSAELDLKKAAGASGNRKIEMLPLRELTPLTGYVRGGCSPLGMKKKFPFFMDEIAQVFDSLAVSAGRKGLQMVLAPADLQELAGGEWADLT